MLWNLLYNSNLYGLAAFSCLSVSMSTVPPTTGKKAVFYRLMWHLHLVAFCFSIAPRRSAKAARIQAANQSALSTRLSRWWCCIGVFASRVLCRVSCKAVCMCMCVLVYVHACRYTALNRISENSRLALPRGRHQGKRKETKRKCTQESRRGAEREERGGTFGNIFKPAPTLMCKHE